MLRGHWPTYSPFLTPVEITCQYDARRNKPGLRSGVVDSLSQRLERVEQAVFGSGQSETSRGSAAAVRLDSLAPLAGACAALVTELQGLSRSLQAPSTDASRGRVNIGRASIDETLPDIHGVDEISNQSCSRKRARHEAVDDASGIQDDIDRQPDDWMKSLFTTAGLIVFTQPVLEELVEDMLDLYFTRIQPWVPMLHEQSIRSGLNDPAEREIMMVILRAMTVVTLRYLEIDGRCLETHHIDAMTKKLKSEILLEAMTGLSIRNVQALIIMAFMEVSCDISSHCQAYQRTTS